MPRRPEQLAHELRDVVGSLLVERVEFPEGTLVTVTRVEDIADGRNATVLVSVLPPQKGPEVLNILEAHLFDIQGEVYTRLDRHPGPRIRFALDASTTHPS